jgi:hypothetical protein
VNAHDNADHDGRSRDLADKLSRGMEQIHGCRIRTLAQLGEQESGAVQP